MQTPKKHSLKMFGIGFLCASLLMGIVFYVYAASSLSPIYIEQGIFPSFATYTIWQEGGVYYAKNQNGHIVSYNANRTVLISYVESLVDDTGGNIYLKGVEFPTSIILSGNVIVIEEYPLGHITYYPKGANFIKSDFETNYAHFSFQLYVSPKAIYYQGTYSKTYFVFLDTDGIYTAKIKSYNHNTASWNPTYTIGQLADNDTHRYPAIGVLPNRKLIIFYNAHLAGSNINYRISTNAEDESSWQAEQTFTAIGGFTYPQILSFPDKLVLFIRDYVDADQTRWLRRETTDGVTWSDWVETVNFGDGIYPYFLFQKSGEKIIASGIMGYSGHQPTGLYFVYSEDYGISWKVANGTSVSLPLNHNNSLALSVTNTTSATSSYIDGWGRPTITAARHDPTTPYQNSRLYIAQYLAPLGYSSSWIGHNATDNAGNELLPENGHWQWDSFGQVRNGKIEVLLKDSDNRTTLFEQTDGSYYQFKVVYKDSAVLAGNEFHADFVQDSNFVMNGIDFIVDVGVSLDEGEEEIGEYTIFGLGYSQLHFIDEG